MNILFEYLYRDAGNNKVWGEVVFTNKFNIDVTAIDESLKSGLIEGEFFVAKDIGIPSLQFGDHDEDLDHGWHEYFSVMKTADAANDYLDRDISVFIKILYLLGCSQVIKLASRSLL